MSPTDWTLHYLHFPLTLKNTMIIAEMEFGTSFVDKEIEALINLKTFLVA